MNTLEITEPSPETTKAAPVDFADPPLLLPTSPIPESQATGPSINAVLGVADILSADEEVEFQSCEVIIQKGSFAFVEVGMALTRIRDGRLYRNDFTSFEGYYQAKWEMQHAKVYYLISAAQVYTTLSALSHVPKPDRESQLRPLLALSAEDAQLAWEYAAVNSGGREITARRVESAVKELHLIPDATPEPGTKPLRRNTKQQRRLMDEAIGELLMLLSKKASHEILTEKVEALHRLMRACFADRRG